MGQLFTAIGAAACVLAYFIGSFIHTSDFTALASLVAISAITTGIISYKYGFQTITLPLYATAAFLVLARSHVSPFYSSDVGW